MPTTSLASPGAFAEEYEKAKEAGDTAIVIAVASGLSGTYQSAVIASEGYDNIFVVDSGNVAIASGILVELALEMVDAGKSAQEIVDALEEAKKKVTLVALVDTLEYLQRGGRVSKAMAVAGNILNIKPLLLLEDGAIDKLGMARGAKMGNRMLCEEIENMGGIDFSKPILYGYTGTSDEAVIKYIEYCKKNWDDMPDGADYTSVGSVIGTHAGPGAIAIAFFRN